MTVKQSALVQTRISPGIKRQAEKALEAYGMTLSDAMRIFAHIVAKTKGFPLDIRPANPNVETVAAMCELDAGGGEEFDSPKELFASWRK